MKGRLLIAFTLTIGLALLLTWAVAAQEAKVTADVQLTRALTTYLPAVFRGSGACSTIPTLNSPANGSNLSTIAPLYVWDDGSSPTATSFRLQVARDAAFVNRGPSLRTGIHGVGEFRFSTNLDPSTTYYWRTYLMCGDSQGPYSDVWVFTTGSGGTVLPAPALVAPANGSAVPTQTVTLQWSSVPGAVEYLVRWRTLDEDGYTYWWLNDAQMANSWLDANTTYEWWVSARNDYAIGADSEKWQFTTPVGSLSAPTKDLNRSFVAKDSSATLVFAGQGSK